MRTNNSAGNYPYHVYSGKKGQKVVGLYIYELIFSNTVSHLISHRFSEVFVWGNRGRKVRLSYNMLDNNQVTNMRSWSPYQVVIYVKKEKNNPSESRKIKGAVISQILQIYTDVDREVTVSALLSHQTTMNLILLFVIDLFQGT